MDPAPVANTAAAESSQPPRGEEPQSEHGKTRGSRSSTKQDSAKMDSDPAAPQGRSDARQPAATGSDGSSQERAASTSSSESTPAGGDAGEPAPAVPAAEQRIPKSFVVPALVVAAVVLLIVSVVVGSIIWGGGTRTTASPTSTASGGTVTSGRTATSAGTVTSRATDAPIGPTTPCPAIPNLKPNAAVATTTVGRLVGSTLTIAGVRMSRWLGVPYAESTAGERRFAKPVPLNVTDQCMVVEALRRRPPCAQWIRGGVVGNEDCLRFNIWAPADPLSGNAKRSLVVALTEYWFQRGNNDLPQWKELATQAGVVVMSPNVRLGVLGFLHPHIRSITPDVALEDAMAAIRWAQDNAAAFGADPSALMLVGHGTGGYMLAEASGRLGLNVSRAVLEGALYSSVMPLNVGPMDPCQTLAAHLSCSGGDVSAWMACFSNAPLDELLNATAAMELRFTPGWDPFLLIDPGESRKLPKFTDVIGGADIAQARALVDEYIRPKAEANGSASTDDELLTFTVQYLIGNSPFVPIVVEKLRGGSHEANLVQLALAVSGCGTRTAANIASRGHHYVVDSGSQPLFEPMLSTADVATFLTNGKVPNLKNGEAWPSSKNSSRFLFANGTEVSLVLELCIQLDQPT